jgi:hypothetical protein
MKRTIAVEFDTIQFDARFDIDRPPERAGKNPIKALGLREGFHVS